jgi:hypothetical protein
MVKSSPQRRLSNLQRASTRIGHQLALIVHENSAIPREAIDRAA